jgi:hypothetical protein
MGNVSIIYITGRAEPHVEWALEAISKQRDGNDTIDFLIIDALARSLETLVPDPMLRAVAEEMRVFPVKPNIWQGKHRVTSVDWWSKSNSANTGLCLARHGYLAFLDDCCRPGEHWLSNVRVGNQARKSVIAGSYSKVENGGLTPDSRIKQSPTGRTNCGGGWLFGCTFALPLEWALTINGFEEGCDGLSSEDTTFGLMLQNAGYRIDYVPSMYVELERAAQGNSYVRTDRGTSPNDKSHAALYRFGRRSRTEFTPDLRELRRQVMDGGEFPIPDPNGDYRDWYDNTPIRDIQPPP